MKVGKIKQLSKKSLSVLLAVIMIMSSMSICFGTVSFAEGGTPTDAQWTELVNALNNANIAGASFSETAANQYKLTDPDGTILPTVDAYWAVFTALANTNPATGSNKGTNEAWTTGSTEGNRVINQVNETIRNTLSSRMGSAYTDAMNAFITKLACGMNVSANTGNVQTKTQTGSDNTTLPGTNLTAISDAVLTVMAGSSLKAYTLDNLPEKIVTQKTYTVSHGNDKYDSKYKKDEKTEGSGCNATTTTTYTRDYRYFYYIKSYSAKTGAEVETAILTQARDTLAAKAAFFSMSMEELVTYSVDKLAEVKTAINSAYDSVLTNFGSDIWNYFFESDYPVETLAGNITLATEIIGLAEVCLNLNSLVKAGYDSIITNEAALRELYSALTAGLNYFDASTEGARNFVTTHEYNNETFVRADVQAFADAVLVEIKLIELRKLKAEIDNKVPAYYAYNEDNVTGAGATVSSATVALAKGTVNSYINTINSYPENLVNQVMGGYKAELTILATELSRLVTISGYNDQFSAEYTKYLDAIYAATKADASSADILAALKGNADEGVESYDAWYTGLKALLSKIENDIGTDVANKIFEENDAKMKAHMELAYVTLHSRVLAQIDYATEKLAVLRAVGNANQIIYIGNFATYKAAFNAIEKDVYDFLIASSNFSMPQTTIDKYNALSTDFKAFDDFVTTGGFGSYKQIFGEYVNREVLDTDIIRNEEYVVTSEKVANVIAGLDKAITSNEVGALLATLLGGEAEDGEAADAAGFDIGAMLKDLIADMLFSDAFINTVVQMLNPILIDALANIWLNNLPSTVDVPIVGTKNVTYKKSLKTVTKDVGLYIFPDLLASRLDSTKYADNIKKLNDAITYFNSDFGVTNSADQDKYYTYYTKDDGTKAMDKSVWDSPRLLDEEGKLTLTWGVDAAKEAGIKGDELAQIFYNAFDDAMDGLRPLLEVLFANQAWENSSSDVAECMSMGVKLTISATGNKGYANLIVPLFEALDVSFTSVSTVENTHSKDDNSIAKILEDIIGPIFTLCDEIGAAPLSKIITILPNLCYALTMQSLPKLLGMLQTKIHYAASVNIGCDYDAASDDIDINVGEMLNINDLIDLTGGVNSLLSLLGLPLPTIDQGKIAQMGELTQKSTQRSAYTYTGASSGKAYFIEADQGAVGYYLLQYIFDIITDEEAFKGLLGMLITKEVPVLDGNGEPTYDEDGNAIVSKVADEEKIAETVASFGELGLFSYGTSNAIAAIVELFNQETNDNYSDYLWYDEGVYEDGTVTNLTPAMIAYLSYNSSLSREKATYIVEHLDELIGSILDMVNGNEEGTFALSETLGGLINGLFTNANITALAKAISVLGDINALIAGAGTSDETTEGDANEPETVAEGEEAAGLGIDLDVNGLIRDVLGIDLSAFAEYAELADDATWGFEDGDAAGFAAALVNVLAPLTPVLDFILAGENITAFTDDSGSAITILGYNGYDAAFVPLLEALGCEVEALGEDDNALAVIINAIVAKLDSITGEDADAVDAILDILPGLLYFIQSNGLSSLVNNLLHPVYALLDAIRPIYEVNFNELLATLTASLPFTLDLNSLDMSFVIGLVKELVGLDLSYLGVLIADVCKVTATDYTSVSSVIGENGKKGAYTELFTKADLVMVVLNFAFTWCTEQDNVDALAAIIANGNAETEEKVKTYIANIYALIEGVDYDDSYGEINWAYAFPNGFEDSIFSSGISIQPTIESLNYPTDWTEDTAKYISENLDALIAAALKLAGVEGTLGDMLKSNISFLTGENLDKLVALLVDLLGKLNTEIVNNAGVLIGADLDALRAYKAEKDTYTTVEFAQELAKILGVIPEVVNLVFFDTDFTLFNYADGKPVATISGAEGYAEGLAPILEALGCKNLPVADSKDVEAVLVSIANRFDEILADPINEVLNVLPNIIYFLNANGISVSVKNILTSVTGFMALLKDTFGVNVDLIAIINDALNGLLPAESELVIDANNLTLETVFALVQELLGLDLTVASNILVNFCVGKLEPYNSLNGEVGFKMEYDDNYARYDMITILVTIALMLVENEQNAKALDEMIGTDIMSGLKEVFASAPVVYTTPDWDYCWDEDGNATGTTIPVVDKALEYPNNWTEESAKYIAENLGAIGDMIAGAIDSKYTTLGVLVADKVNIYSGANIEAIAGAVADLLADIDDTLLEAAGLLLKVDVVGLKNYTAPAGIDTADEFAAELANVLTTYAGGLINWLLFGEDYRFFVDETALGDNKVYDKGEEIITINGGYGYGEGLALLLEALGVEDLPAADSKDVEGILKATFARLDAILANPAVEVFNLLPNLLYFLNANGVAIAIDNLTAAITTLINKLAVFDLELNIAELIDIKTLLEIENDDLEISIDNLTVEAILELVAYLTGLDLEVLTKALSGFALGEVKAYESISRKGVTYKMYYDDEFAVYDMITILATLVIVTVQDEDNADVLKEFLGEDIYTLVTNLFNMGEVKVQDFDWKFTDKANTGYVFSAIESSKIYDGDIYGDVYTEDMANYIADNFGEFVDNVVYLLGININGKSVDNLKDLINGLVNGSLYNSANVVAIRDALAGVLANVNDLEVNGAKVGPYIAAVLKNAKIADINAVAEVEVPEFTESREKFVTYLCDVLEPLYGVLKYVLADEDITFFVNLDETDAITLKGAEGYVNGIIPLLETLECQNIVAPEAYYEAVAADNDVILTSILNPLLDRVDVILDNPADEILNMLPNLIYFINSNGVDTVVKNTLNAVYSLLAAIEPIAKIDLYELIGLDLSTLTFEKLFGMLLDMIAESTGYEFTALDASAIVELSVGTLVSYDSLTGKTAYKMVYASTDSTEGGKTEMVAVVERLLLTFIMHENNQEMLIGLLKDNLGMTADGEKYMRAVLKLVADCTLDTKLGMETALATLYFIYFGADIGVGETANGLKDLNAEWTAILKEMRESSNKEEAIAGEIISELLGLDIFKDIIDPEDGLAPNGLVAFFQKIASFFQKIADWFKNLFN